MAEGASEQFDNSEPEDLNIESLDKEDFKKLLAESDSESVDPLTEEQRDMEEAMSTDFDFYSLEFNVALYQAYFKSKNDSDYLYNAEHLLANHPLYTLMEDLGTEGEAQPYPDFQFPVFDEYNYLDPNARNVDDINDLELQSFSRLLFDYRKSVAEKTKTGSSEKSDKLGNNIKDRLGDLNSRISELSKFVDSLNVKKEGLISSDISPDALSREIAKIDEEIAGAERGKISLNLYKRCVVQIMDDTSKLYEKDFRSDLVEGVGDILENSKTDAAGLEENRAIFVRYREDIVSEYPELGVFMPLIKDFFDDVVKYYDAGASSEEVVVMSRDWFISSGIKDSVNVFSSKGDKEHRAAIYFFETFEMEFAVIGVSYDKNY